MRREAIPHLMRVAGAALILCALGFGLGCAVAATVEDPADTPPKEPRRESPPLWEVVPPEQRKDLPMELWWRPRNMVMTRARRHL